MMVLNRGDIVIVNLYPRKGDEVSIIRTLSKIRIKEKIAQLSDEEYDLITQALCKNFQ